MGTEIHSNLWSFANHPQEALKVFSSRIYLLRLLKNCHCLDLTIFCNYINKKVCSGNLMLC